MNIRNIYFALIVALSLGLLYEWSSEQRSQSVEDHLLDASFPSFEVGEDYVAIENQQLYVVIAVNTGAIVETRLKEYKVENESDYVELVDPLIGVSKRVSFKDAEYEISVYDSSLEGEEGKSFAGLYRTSGRALDLTVSYTHLTLPTKRIV